MSENGQFKQNTTTHIRREDLKEPERFEELVQLFQTLGDCEVSFDDDNKAVRVKCIS